MNEKQTVRPTKKQKELLSFIETFIAEHGYSPSYREIMGGVGYNSVATVALHVNNLIRRGHLRKRDHSARSLEVTTASGVKPKTTTVTKPAEEEWLIEKIEQLFDRAEESATLAPDEFEKLRTLMAALQILDLKAAYAHCSPRFKKLETAAESH